MLKTNMEAPNPTHFELKSIDFYGHKSTVRHPPKCPFFSPFYLQTIILSSPIAQFGNTTGECRHYIRVPMNSSRKTDAFRFQPHRALLYFFA